MIHLLAQTFVDDCIINEMQTNFKMLFARFPARQKAQKTRSQIVQDSELYKYLQALCKKLQTGPVLLTSEK